MHANITLSWAIRASLTAVLVLAVAAGCGGGVGTGGTGGNATAYAAGPITGFGSVIVGGVRFDDSAAKVEDGEGGRRSRDELRLGMTVEVDSSAVATDASGASTASASRIRFESELVGLVGAVDVAGSSFQILGQTVTVDATTVFDPQLSNGLAGLRGTDRLVEVYAVFDPVGQRYRATRVEPSNLASGFRLRGPVLALDAQTLRVGATSYSYTGAAGIPANLAVGQFVRLRLVLGPGPGVRWGVQSFGTALQALADANEVEVEGLISGFNSSTSFSVNGRPVDASAATFSSGNVSLAQGVRVQVEGSLRGGTVYASKVTTLSDNQVRDRGFELIGAITAVDLSTITLRGLTVSTARPDLRYDSGGPNDLRVGANVEVRGVLATDGRTLEATRIRFR